MSSRNEQFARVLVAALAASGVKHACVTPGSRNAPLSIALADSVITDWSHHDERSAAFFALGIARITRRPAAIVTTSGTAAAELHPALAEAAAARIPLVAITADRPTELLDVGAPQTINQRDLFGRTVRWSYDLDVPDPDDAGRMRTAALAARLVSAATGRPAGPVHLNIRFREPLLIGDDTYDVATPLVVEGELAPDAAAVAPVSDAISGRRGVVVAGPQGEPSVAAAATTFAAAVGWPVMADPVSGLRVGDHPVDAVVGSDLLAAAGWLEKAAPEAVLRIGAAPTSKALRVWLAENHAIPQIVIDPGGWRDPTATAHTIVRADTAAALRALGGSGANPAPADWLESWKNADVVASAAAAAAIADGGYPSEPAAVSAVAVGLRDGASLWAASSMPIRDVDSFFPVSRRPGALFANRGANGIDGFISTALGAAATGDPTVALAGDISMLHDVGALGAMARIDIPLTIVVLNNDGGGIFHFLPQDGHEHFERHFGTPHGLRFADIAASFGVKSSRADTAEELIGVVADAGTVPFLVEVVTDRSTNVALHREIAVQVKEAVAAI